MIHTLTKAAALPHRCAERTKKCGLHRTARGAVTEYPKHTQCGRVYRGVKAGNQCTSTRSSPMASVAVALLLLVCFMQPSVADSTPMHGIFHWTLDNGLDVFAVENHAAPLAYIEIAVKAGGITQTRESAGLFHLYEHMMFKGNSLYPTAAAVQKAISDLGVPDWNGTTGLECVNYFFTVPSASLREGMEFWSRAIREPLLDAGELEREKKVVLSEITADTSDPSYLAMKCALTMMFPDAPWQVDPSGSPDNVKNATVDKIKDIQKTYYVPNNAALFVAGDVTPNEVYCLAQELYGKWERGEEVPPPSAHSSEPLAGDKFMVSVDDTVPSGTAYITVYLRAPDVSSDVKATYAGDMTLSLFNDPAGPLAQDVMAAGIGVSSPERVGMGYQTRRASSLVTFSAMVNGTDDLAQRVNKFLSTVRDVCGNVASGKEKIPSSVFKRTLKREQDGDIIDSQMPDVVKSSLRYWWTVESADYYYTYNKNLGRTKEKDVKAFLSCYINGKNALVIVSVNGADYKAEEDKMQAANFKAVDKSNALWWEK